MTTFRPSPLSRFAMAIVIVLLICLSWAPVLDNTANKHIDDGLTRSLTSFATARALNGIISLAQGTEAAFQPAGVGVVLTPGQVLDPINDLVESFSDLMLVASIAYGVEKILIEIGATHAIAVLITLLGVSWAILHVLGKSGPTVLSRFLVILLVVRFAVPVMTVGSNWLFEQFMEGRYQKSQRFLEKAAPNQPVVNTQKSAAAASAKGVDKPRWYDGLLPEKFAIPSFKIPKSPVGKIKEKLAASVGHIIDIMVIFILQVVVLPLVILWILYSSGRRMIES